MDVFHGAGALAGGDQGVREEAGVQADPAHRLLLLGLALVLGWDGLVILFVLFCFFLQGLL